MKNLILTAAITAAFIGSSFAMDTDGYPTPRSNPYKNDTVIVEWDDDNFDAIEEADNYPIPRRNPQNILEVHAEYNESNEFTHATDTENKLEIVLQAEALTDSCMDGLDIPELMSIRDRAICYDMVYSNFEANGIVSATDSYDEYIESLQFDDYTMMFAEANDIHQYIRDRDLTADLFHWLEHEMIGRTESVINTGVWHSFGVPVFAEDEYLHAAVSGVADGATVFDRVACQLRLGDEVEIKSHVDYDEEFNISSVAVEYNGCFGWVDASVFDES